MNPHKLNNFLDVIAIYEQDIRMTCGCVFDVGVISCNYYQGLRLIFFFKSLVWMILGCNLTFDVSNRLEETEPVFGMLFSPFPPEIYYNDHFGPCHPSTTMAGQFPLGPLVLSNLTNLCNPKSH